MEFSDVEIIDVKNKLVRASLQDLDNSHLGGKINNLSETFKRLTKKEKVIASFLKIGD